MDCVFFRAMLVLSMTMNIRSNTVSAPIRRVWTIKKVVGLSSGTVMLKNCRNPVAPSMAAAS